MPTSISLSGRGRRIRSRALALPGEDAVSADEIRRGLFDAVDPSPQADDLVAAQDLVDAVQVQIADYIALVVVLAAENALPARRDVQMLQRPRSDVVASGQILLFRRRLE